MDTETIEIAQISFFLAKEEVTFESIFANGKSLASQDGYKCRDFEVDDTKCRFLYFQTTSRKNNPPWLDFANEQFKDTEKVTFASTGKNPNGILLLKIQERTFAATFGRSATSYLDRRAIESDFGIKTAMNMCGNEEIRQTKSSSNTITTTQIDRQVSRPADTFTFGLSEAEDLKFISAHMKSNPNITLQGRNNLTVKVIGKKKLDWPALIRQCRDFLNFYSSKDYIELFPNYHNFRPANEDELLELDAALIETLQKHEFDSLRVSIPEFVAEDEFSFTYTNNGKRENICYSYLESKQLGEVMDLTSVKIDSLHSKYIFAYSHEEDRVLPYKKWSVYDCIVFEKKLGEKYFILNEGKWSQVDDEFYSSITKFISEKLSVEPCEPMYGGIDISDSKAMMNKESIFNEEVCKRRPSNVLFDRAKLKIGGGRRDKEFCDILDMQDDGVVRIIHCKPHKDASSVNYLFSQAKFYCEAFLSDQIFLHEIRAHIGKSNSTKKDEYLSAIPPNLPDVCGNEFVVCLWLLYDDKDRPPTKERIPLISQYELKLMHDHLRNIHKFKKIVLRFVPVKVTSFKQSKKPKPSK